MPEYTTFDRRGDADLRRQAEIFRLQCELGECVEGRIYQFDRSRQRFFECHDHASHKARQRESPRVIVAAAESFLRQRLGRTPRQIVERYWLVKPATIEPLTDFEFQMYEDPVIRRPDNYDERLSERNRLETIARKAEVAGLIQRVAAAKERQEARLYGVQRYHAGIERRSKN